MVEREAERPELLLVPPRPEGHPQPAAAELVDRSGRTREQPRLAERGARDQWAELDPLRHHGKAGEHGPAVPRSALRTVAAAIEQMVSDPDRVEAGLLRRAGELRVLGPAHLALDLRKLDADLHAQNSAKASGSVGNAVTSVQTPSACVMSSTWSMSRARPSRVPRAR